MKVTIPLSALLLSAGPSLAAAGEASPSEPPAAPAAPASEGQEASAGETQSFSGGRYALGVLASAAAGGLAAFGVLKGVCGDEVCLGGAIGGLVANVVVSPLAAWGAGRAMGGRGDLGTTYLGGLLGFSVGGPLTQVSPGTALAVGSLVMPFMASLAFELTSMGAPSDPDAAQRDGGPTLTGIGAAPLGGPRGEIGGGLLGVSGRW
jgi:hypothetical protein